MPPISAVIITRNEAAVIGRCIDSLTPVVDEVVVIDAESTDETVAIARERGAKVMVRPWDGFTSARNHGLDQASNDFILSLDADEVVSDELAAEISTMKPSLEGVYTTPVVPRLGGRWIKHCGWYGARVKRLFDRRLGRWEQPVHEHFVPRPGTSIRPLQGMVLHYSPLTLTAYAEKVNRYSTLECERSILLEKRVGFRHLTIRPLQEFFRVYVLKQGFRDGFAGYCIAILSAYYRFLWMAKLWERTRLRSDETD